MPALSPTMTKGKIASWNKKEGDKITAGDVLAEIETDKATVAFEATDDGYMAKILVPKGAEDVPLGTPVCVVVSDQADVPKFKDFKAPAAAAAAPPPPPSPPSPPLAAPNIRPAAAPAAAPSPPKAAPAPQPAAAPASAAPSGAAGQRVFASPFARTLAKERGFDIAQIPGTGPGGRVIAQDVLGFQPAPAGVRAAAAIISEHYTDQQLTNLRKIIAQRLTESKQQIPHYYLTSECRVDKLLKLRTEFAEAGHKLSINDFVIKASALAMRKVPEVNSSWMGEFIRRYHNVDINIAVNTENGLYVPLIRNVERLGLTQISSTVKELAEKAKQNKLSPSEVEIGTFTISNLGMFGIKHFAAVILPPQACILAVGASEKRIVPVETKKGEKPAAGEPEFTVSNFISVTLSCDHRVVDGAVGAQWLAAFKELIEDPVKMLL